MTTLALLSQGVLLGLSAGAAPGPLLALVVSQTVRHGAAEGVKAALAPLVTDLPIILGVTFLLSRVADARGILGTVTVAGAAFVAFLAWESFRAPPLPTGVEAGEARSVSRGAAVNALSPHPYLFWAAVGGPLLVRAWSEDRPGAAAFLAGFYVCLVGSKVAVALLVGQTRRFLTGRLYRGILRGLGALLLLFSGRLLWDGVALLASRH
ncbi:MAG: LysE family transporter [Deltaproteobacteria bacterium]|nr:LysE family transporter [Deltaproteobacteria bacterium]